MGLQATLPNLKDIKAVNMRTNEYTLLDTHFTVEVFTRWILRHSDEFMRAYRDPYEHSTAEINVVKIQQVDYPGEPEGEESARRPVHRSKHPRWSFDAVTHNATPQWWHWEERGFCVRRVNDDSRSISEDTEPDTWQFGIKPNVEPAVVSESLFHLLRSIAIYKRSRRNSHFLHASGVVSPNTGKAVLFTGSVSAGKTTLMTHAVLKANALPLTNDRAWVLCEGSNEVCPQIVSWPSYASYCEGTLLNDDRLRSGAVAFEEQNSILRVTKNDRPLQNRFDKDAKRIYPMGWFSDIANCKYETEAPLATISISQVDPYTTRSTLRELNPAGSQADRAMILTAIETEQFDSSEPSFRDWHGMHYTSDNKSKSDLIDRCLSSGVRFVALHASPRDLSVVGELL